MKTLIFLITIIAATSLVRANEIIPIWNRTIEAPVQDMEFLKGQDEIILLVGEGPNAFIQIRSSVDGELIQSVPNQLSTNSHLSITPDSTKFVYISGAIGRLKTIDDEFSTINQFFIPQEEDSILLYFKSITIDPTRPIAYVTTEGWDKENVDYADKYKVVAFNYETGELIKDITPYGSEDYPVVEISTDGKYLAIMNDGQTYLKIWDLEKDELIINEPLYDEDSQDKCKPKDIYISKIDEGLIFYSGFFTETIDGKRRNGVFSINKSSLLKKRIVPNGLYDGSKMIFIDNETRVAVFSPSRIAVLNLLTKNLDWYGKQPENIYTTITAYSNTFDFFLGTAGSSNISKFRYDRETSVINNYEEEIVISPNPTQSYVSINVECVEPSINYSIYNTDSVLMVQDITVNQQDRFTIDFSPYPTGVYFLTFTCNNAIKTYKIIKEG